MQTKSIAMQTKSAAMQTKSAVTKREVATMMPKDGALQHKHEHELRNANWRLAEIN